MYKQIFDTIEDRKGAMALNSPDPKYAADVITDLYQQANVLSKVYKIMMTPYEGENDFYTLLADLSEAFDEINFSALTSLRLSYLNGTIFSLAERWIIPSLVILYDDSNKGTLEDSTLTAIRNVVEECEYIPMAEFQALASSLYRSIASMYMELFNTYGLDDFVHIDAADELPKINFVTKGFNEFLMREDKSIEEMATIIYDKTQEFIFVANEVDKDEATSKKIRAMVPEDLKAEFEDVIELITEEQVAGLLNGTIRINKRFIDSLIGDDSDGAM